MYLYFENSQGKRRLLSQPKTEKDCFKQISKFLEEHNFVSYYMRTWKPYEHVTQVDVGSHTEFFYMSECPIELEGDCICHQEVVDIIGM